MPTVSFTSRPEVEVIEIRFLTVDGREKLQTLLVDSGFTGQSSFILADDATELVQSAAASCQAAGALSGTQQRALVTCRIPELSFERSFLAILTDVSQLALPPGVHGMAGLRFLRHFHRWGAEQADDSTWHFFLSDETAAQSLNQPQ